MNTAEFKNKELAKARFEFRSFGQNFENAAKRMARLSLPVPENYWERASYETYILSRVNNTCNSKIRDEKIDIKTFVQTIDGLEQWLPLLKKGFPLSASDLINIIFPAWAVVIPEIARDTYTYSQFIELVDRHPQLQKVHVHKIRFGYMVNNTICESGVVLINGASVFTISSESNNIEDVKKTLKDIGLDNTENINYVQVIKRVTGMVDLALAN